MSFENVQFGYEPGKPVLHGVTFDVEPGQVVAFVGSSGAGKSTVLNLLLRFSDPWQGRVSIDRSDIRRYRLDRYGGRLPWCFRFDTFPAQHWDNIAYGSPRATTDDIVRAAKAARAHDFISDLPEGYETMLDEQGSNLSGGQRQRLALARAFLRDAPILILDEPTSGLDSVTESQLTDTIDELGEGKNYADRRAPLLDDRKGEPYHGARRRESSAIRNACRIDRSTHQLLCRSCLLSKLPATFTYR